MRSGGIILLRNKLNNRRFRKKEAEIIEVFLGNDKTFLISPTKIAKDVGVSRTTLFRHHNPLVKIYDDYEKLLYYEFNRELMRINKEEITLSIFFRSFLVFIIRHKKMFLIVFKNGAEELIKKMTKRIKPWILKNGKSSRKTAKMFDVVLGEVYVLIEGWEKRGFPENEIEVLLYNLVYLVETARIRLSALR